MTWVKNARVFSFPSSKVMSSPIDTWSRERCEPTGTVDITADGGRIASLDMCAVATVSLPEELEGKF